MTMRSQLRPNFSQYEVKRELWRNYALKTGGKSSKLPQKQKFRSETKKKRGELNPFKNKYSKCRYVMCISYFLNLILLYFCIFDKLTTGSNTKTKQRDKNRIRSNKCGVHEGRVGVWQNNAEHAHSPLLHLLSVFCNLYFVFCICICICISDNEGKLRKLWEDSGSGLQR